MTFLRYLAAFVLAVLAVAPTSASAQAHAGIDVNVVVPADMEIVDVVVPDRPESPLRLSLGPQAEGRTELIVDVWVTADARGAAAAYQRALLSLTGEVSAAPGLGDRGVADDGFAAFARDNVTIAIRRARGARDVRAFAAHLDGAIRAAPVGTAHATGSLQLPALDAMSPGDTATISLPRWVLDATLLAEGDATVRRTRTGWLVTRTGSGPAHIDAHVADLRLRTTP